MAKRRASMTQEAKDKEKLSRRSRYLQNRESVLSLKKMARKTNEALRLRQNASALAYRTRKRNDPEWVARTKQRTVEFNKKSREKSKAFIQQYKSTHPCTRCGESDIYCLDFHHTDPSSKLHTINAIGHCSISAIKKEIAKCIILCSNCHRKFHQGITK